ACAVRRSLVTCADELATAAHGSVPRTADPAHGFHGAAGDGGVDAVPSSDALDAAAADVRVADGPAQYVFDGAAEHGRADRRASVYDIDAAAVEREIAHSAAPHRYRAAALDDDDAGQGGAAAPVLDGQCAAALDGRGE